MRWIITYMAAIVVANLSVAHFGVKFVIFNSFVLIGFDLFARDKLHERWHNQQLKRNMILLIFTGSTLTAMLSINSLRVAVASFWAFSAAGIADTITYQALFTRPRLLKMNTSNVVSGAFDTIVFMLIAFGLPFLWQVAIQNYIAKVAGGAFWTIVFSRKETL